MACRELYTDQSMPPMEIIGLGILKNYRINKIYTDSYSQAPQPKVKRTK